jgi:hypothetical protein
MRDLDRRFAAMQLQMDQRFDAAEKSVTIAMTASEKAVDKAQEASEKRFDGVNEFRKALSDQTSTFIPRAEHESQYKALADRVTSASERTGALELRLTSRLDTSSGEKAGSEDSRTMSRDHRTQAVSVTVMILVVVATLVSVASFIVSLLVHAHP